MHEKRKGRLPPSVMMAKFALEAAAPGNSIAGALDAISACMLAALEQAQAAGALVDIRNPCCHEECFTDRCPENPQAQRLYIDLKRFRQQLAALMSDQLGQRDLLVVMFGEGPAQAAIDEYAATVGRAVKDGSRSIAPSGRVLAGTLVAAPALVRSALSQPRPHTFFGSRRKRR